MTTEEIEKILIRYKAGQCTDLEKTIIEETFMKFHEGEPDLSPKRIRKIGVEIYKVLPGVYNKSRTIKLWPLISAAACVSIIMIGILIFYSRNEIAIVQDNLAQDIKPGTNKATITLANGKTIALSSKQTGVVIDINKLTYSDGTPIQKLDNRNEVKNTHFNTINTPRGGTYQIILPDGSKVWLNAATTIKIPTDFIHQPKRFAEIIGEAYFEIAKDKTHPFIVKSQNQEIEVLGTYFNVNSYTEDQDIKTTLLEGSVHVAFLSPPGRDGVAREGSNTNRPSLSEGHLSQGARGTKPQSVILKPGQQSVNSGSKMSIQEVDPNEAIAWKNGEFMFRKEPLASIMEKVARWYDLEVVYQNPALAKKPFGGTISKFEKVSKVLQMLELTGEVHFKIEGRRVVIMD